MDHIEERRFVLNSFQYIFNTNHVTLPSCLGELMNTLNCNDDALFDSTMRLALKEIMKNQHPVRQRMYRQTLETYYYKMVSESYTERELLEFICFHIGSSILESLLNPYAAVEKYRMIMSVIVHAKARNEFTRESHSRLRAAAEQVIIESILRKQSKDCYPKFRRVRQVQNLEQPSTSSEDPRVQNEDNYLRPIRRVQSIEKLSTSSVKNIQHEQGGDNYLMHRYIRQVQNVEKPSSSSEFSDGSGTIEEYHLDGGISQGLKRKLDYGPIESKSLKTDCGRGNKMAESIDSGSDQFYEHVVRESCKEIRTIKDKISNSIQVYKQVLREINTKKYRMRDIMDEMEEIEEELSDLEMSHNTEVRKKSL